MIGDRMKCVICYQKLLQVVQDIVSLAQEKYQNNKATDLPVPKHCCPQNQEGSTKGMEAKAALECVTKVWTHGATYHAAHNNSKTTPQ
jgi:hypothetical protein